MHVPVQVKLRGFRIELGEVEAAIMDLPGVVMAAALVLLDVSKNQQLVGYVTPETVDPAMVRDSLKARLPAHFVPQLVMPLRQMPLLPNGKVDRKALASRAEYQPDWLAAATAEEYVAPRSDLERAVQAVWQEVLGLAQVSVKSSFFNIGGNSITANKVSSRLRAALDTPLSGGMLFQHPTIAKLATQLAAAGVGRGDGQVSTGQLVPCAGYDAAARAAGVPVSSQQEQLLRAEVDRLMYMESFMTERVKGSLDVHALLGAWEALIMRHAVLRSRYKEEGERLLQVLPIHLIMDNLHILLSCSAKC